ncbi:hypothetical protein K457DRAFT_713079 [Linnemannia elongata AG-77]|uniref:Uncharacterized protein n=1 Tax=Linnemannia elongata AG-77 TaxID=1314771 RepID=A0A197KEH4_9FUNG|nr:hypothetical protein K457DRAFT_713079 [Linnemannia elongata AG-77]
MKGRTQLLRTRPGWICGSSTMRPFVRGEHWVKATCKHSVPLSRIAVFRSGTFKVEAKLWQLDFRDMFWLFHFDSFFSPLKKSEFGKKVKLSILRCLKLAKRVNAEVDARGEDAAPLEHEIRELLEEAVSAIQSTSSTPMKNRKRRPPAFSCASTK